MKRQNLRNSLVIDHKGIGAKGIRRVMASCLSFGCG